MIQDKYHRVAANASKKLIILSMVSLATGVIAGKGEETFLASQLDEWFKEATPVGQGLWVTDMNGCLHSVVQGDKGLSIVQMLDKDKKPVCRK